jgi:hypothetical protein
MLSAQPLPADVTVTATALGGVPTAEITTHVEAPVVSWTAKMSWVAASGSDTKET